MAEVYVRIYDNRIKALNAPGQPVGRYVASKGRAIEGFAKAQAPKRSGRLARSIEAQPVKWRGHRSSVQVSVSAPYALFVHEGTGPWIFPNTANYLSVPKYPSITGVRVPRMRMLFVRGQRAQPFLREALDLVMGGSRFLRTFGAGNV